MLEKYFIFIGFFILYANSAVAETYYQSILVPYVDKKSNDDKTKELFTIWKAEMNQKLNALENRITDTIEAKSNELKYDLFDKLEKLDQTFKDNRCSSVENIESQLAKKQFGSETSNTLNGTKPTSSCKEFKYDSLKTSNVEYDIDEDFKQATVTRNRTGYLTKLEMHLAIKTSNPVWIYLNPLSGSDLPENYYVLVGLVRIGQYYEWDLFNNDHRNAAIEVPFHESSTDFVAFYLKLSDEGLQFGKEGDAPVINYKGPIFSVKHVKFEGDGATFLYDCPANAVYS